MNIYGKKFKTIMFLSICILVCIIGGTIGYINRAASIKTDNIPVKYINATYAFDASNATEVVGFCDYVFVGKVETQLGNVYNSMFPKTQYKIKVIKDIKGDLSSYGEVTINKVGGLSKDKNEIILSENDFLPEENETYIFAAFVSDKGELCVQGENSNVLVTNSDSENYTTMSDNMNESMDLIENSQAFLDFEKAYESEKVFNKKRFDFKP